jgi:hypothetical protein
MSCKPVPNTGKRRLGRGLPSEFRSLIEEAQAEDWRLEMSNGNHLRLLEDGKERIALTVLRGLAAELEERRACLVSIEDEIERLGRVRKRPAMTQDRMTRLSRVLPEPRVTRAAGARGSSTYDAENEVRTYYQPTSEPMPSLFQAAFDRRLGLTRGRVSRYSRTSMSVPLLDGLNTEQRLCAKVRTTNKDAARRPVRAGGALKRLARVRR